MTVSFLVACSDGDNTTTYVNEDIATLNSPAQGELPACTADDNGKFFFMPGTKDVVLCSGGAWVSLASNPVSHKDSVGSVSDTTVEKKGSVTNLSAEEIEACTASFDSTDLHSVTIDCGSFSVVTNVYPDEETSIIKGDDIVDARDSTVYRTVVIGKQTWLRDNASYEVGGSKECSYINCGLLYTWDAAQEACPEGTHLPTEEEFQELVHYATPSTAIRLRERTLSPDTTRITSIWETTSLGSRRMLYCPMANRSSGVRVRILRTLLMPGTSG